MAWELGAQCLPRRPGEERGQTWPRATSRLFFQEFPFLFLCFPHTHPHPTAPRQVMTLH